MKTNLSLNDCPNCAAQMKDDFCSNCQSQATLKRINGRYIVSEIMSVLNFEKGFFYTMKELALRPDQCIQNFILNDRKRLVKPITFVIFCSLFYTLVKQNIYDRFLEGFGEGYTDSLGLEASVLINILGWLKQNYGFTNIFISVFIVSWIKLFFKKYNYNFFEILILLLYVTGMGTLVYSVFALLEIVTGLEISYLGTAITLAYYAWAIGRFFDKRKRINYFKALITYILGILTFYFFTILVGTIIDFILYF